MGDEKTKATKTRPIQLLEELDVADYEGMLEKTATVVLYLKGEPRSVVLGTKGWEEERNKWKRANPEPMPPYTEDMVAPDSPLGRQMKADRPVFRRIYDERDPAYLLKLEEWRDTLNYLIAGHCLRLKLRDRGQELTDPGQRAEALKRLGLQQLEAAGIAGMVTALSQLAKAETVDFFDKLSGYRPSGDGEHGPPDHGSSSKPPDSQE